LPSGNPHEPNTERLNTERRLQRARWKRLLPVSATAVLTATLELLGALPAPAARGIVGVWLTNSPSPLYYSPQRIEAAVQELAEAGFNTLYPNVWSRGTTFHPSRHAPLEPALAQAGAAIDPICRLSAAARKRGMRVIPWFEYGLMEPAEAAVVRDNPEWVLQRADGSTAYPMHGRMMAWLNPAHPGVRARFIGLITEIVQRCGSDGIQLDDHFAWPVELGYDPYTRALYAAETGREPPANATDRAWMRWRRQQLTGLLRELRAALARLDRARRTTISLSPGPFRFAYNHWLQDWELWALGELVDDLVVQNYAYSVAGFARDLDQPALVKARSWGMPVEIGILAGFGGRTPTMDMLAEKVRLAQARGHGVIYFYWEGLWGLHAGPEGPTYRRAAFRQLHSRGSLPPRRPPSASPSSTPIAPAAIRSPFRLPPMPPLPPPLP
jgi:uncharacterized lipoprotein YddW (UPF0748 family)